MPRTSALSAAVFATLAACASQSPDTAAPSSLDTSTSAVAVASGGTSAVDLLRQGGTYMFSLDESDPSSRMHEKCTSESGGDKAKAEACYAAIRDEGDHEGMRFAADGDGVVWTSFGRTDGKEAVFIEAKMTVAADGDHSAVASFAEAPRGPQLAGEKDWSKAKIRFAFPDATTMVMNDPTKGKLVFHKR